MTFNTMQSYYKQQR